MQNRCLHGSGQKFLKALPEDENANRAINNLQNSAVEEDGEESKAEENEKDDEYVHSFGRKINLGLEREES